MRQHLKSATASERVRPELVTAGDWLESPVLPRIVTRIAGQYWLREEDVPDLLQETLIALWKLGTSTEINAAWIVRVVSNKAVDIVRRATRARACAQALAQTSLRTSPEPDLEHLLHARVAKLPIRLREFYRFRYTEGLSEREVAARLGLCRGSVRWLDRCCRTRIVGRRLPLDH